MRIGRNEPCPCGSGKKYKKCCLGKEGGEGQRGDLEEKKKALERKLLELGIRIDFNTLGKRINKNKDFREGFPEVYEFNFPSMADFEEVNRLLIDLWNSYPREEFGGKAPKDIDNMGPKERELILDLMKRVKEEINPNKFSSTEEAIKAAEKLKEGWLKRPQEKREGKTPEELILEERKARGNPRKDFSFVITLDKIPDYDENKAEKLYFEGVAALKNKKAKEAAELFEEVLRMYPRNYKAWNNLGCALVELRREEEAIKCAKMALALEPNYELAKNNLENWKRLMLFSPRMVERFMEDYEEEMIKKAENQVLGPETTITAALNKYPAVWINGICQDLGIPKKGRKEEKVGKIRDCLLSGRLDSIVEELPKGSKEALSLILKEGGWVKLGKLGEFGGEIKWWWKNDPPSSILGLLRLKGFLVVGKMGMGRRMYKVGMVPVELRERLKIKIN